MRNFLLATASTALLLVTGSSVAADEIGQAEYMNACAVCHGSMGKGAGSLAPLLTVPVPDLTDLSAQNDGEFPMLKVIMIVDGRTGVRGHGGPMPVWGDRFGAQAGDIGTYATELEVRGRVLSIAQYLESIQR